MKTSFYSICLLAVVLASTAQSQYREMVQDPAQVARRDSIRNVFRVETCCKGTLAACLENHPECSLAPRLDNMMSWMIILGRKSEKIQTELAKRVDFFNSTNTFPLDISIYEPAGKPTSPVTIAMYVSASCPLCKKVTMGIYREVVGGELAGKAILAPIPFGAGMGDQALIAAKKLGRFWPYFTTLAEVKTRLNEDILVRVAQVAGLPVGQFRRLLQDPSIKRQLLKSREAGHQNGVTVTPTVFLNSRRYTSYKDPEWVVDAAQYEYEKIMERKRKK